MKIPGSIFNALLMRCQRRYPVMTVTCAGLLVTGLVWVVTRYVRDDPQTTGALPLPKTTIQARKEPPVHPEDSMRPEIASALGFSGEMPTVARIRELMEVRGQLSAEEIRELMQALLAAPEKDEAKALRSTWFHEVANLLQRQTVDLREFSEVLATVARDEGRDLTTRDYALQHLRITWDKADGDHRLRGSIEATLGEMASARGKLYPTVLLSLHLLDPKGKSGADASTLISEVRTILSDDKATGDAAVQARMVACRVAGERRLEDSRGQLLNLAKSDGAHALERMAAIAALGRFANPSDLNALAALSPRDRRIAGAIQNVLDASPRQ